MSLAINTDSLKGAALDWAVGYARCLIATDGMPVLARDLMNIAMTRELASPSSNWFQAGCVIDVIADLRIKNRTREVHQDRRHEAYIDTPNGQTFFACGETILIAIMRCYVKSTVGDIVHIPEQLIDLQ